MRIKLILITRSKNGMMEHRKLQKKIAKVVRQMELKRDIYTKLLEWKNKNSHKVLELEGARQVGKTFILNLFSNEYHTIFILI